jgi:hypothetical protein
MTDHWSTTLCRLAAELDRASTEEAFERASDALDEAERAALSDPGAPLAVKVKILARCGADDPHTIHRDLLAVAAQLDGLPLV